MKINFRGYIDLGSTNEILNSENSSFYCIYSMLTGILLFIKQDWCLLVFCCLSNKIGTGTQPEYSLWYCNMAANSTSILF